VRLPAARILLSTTLLTILCLAAVRAAPAASGTAAYGFGEVTTSTLNNGLKVVIAPMHTADLVTIDAWVGAGTRREEADNNGVAHFMEHLLFKGTPTRKPGEIDAAIEDLGGTLNASTSYDWAHFYVTVAAADVEPALSVLSDAMINAELRQEDIDHERPVILSEMAREAVSPARRVARAASRLMFPTHPYGRPLLGTEDIISAMQRDTVLDFYHTYYVPGNTSIIVAGQIDPVRALDMVQHAFGGWKGKPAPADKTISANAAASGIKERRLTGPVGTGYCTMGFRAPAVSDQPDCYVMDVLLTILGQGGNSRLEQGLQSRKKLVNTIGANYLTQHDPGILTVNATFEPANIDMVRGAILEEVAALRTAPVSAGELAAAKHSLLASYLFEIQTSSGRADALGFYSVIDTSRYDVDYVDNFESVTADQVREAARKYLDPKAYVFVSLLPADDPTTASSAGHKARIGLNR
jgi:zinc protease